MGSGSVEWVRGQRQEQRIREGFPQAEAEQELEAGKLRCPQGPRHPTG